MNQIDRGINPPKGAAPPEKKLKVNPVKKVPSVKNHAIHQLTDQKGKSILIRDPVPSVEPPKRITKTLVIFPKPSIPKPNDPKEGKDLSTLSQHARELHKQKNYPEAIVYYRRALALPEGQKDIYTISRYAILLMEDNKFEESLVFCEKVFALEGGEKDLYAAICYARCLSKLKKYEQSFQAYRKVFTLPKANKIKGILTQVIEFVCQYVQVLKSENKIEEAGEVLQTALAVEFWYHPILLKEYAKILREQGKNEESKKYDKKADVLAERIGKK